MKFKIFLISALVCLMGLSTFAQLDKKASEAFISRIVGDKSRLFVSEYIPAQNGKDVFELESRRGRIILRGNNGLSVASALNFYLRNYCHSLYSWNDRSVKIPDHYPIVDKKIRKQTPYQYRYYLNYCTFNYSMSWWNWERWQQEIDWMALNGINLPLAITGEEAVWQDVYKQMGFTDSELDHYFTGPAYFSWFWMGNIDEWGGPLPAHWKETHRALQKKILAAERSMGMKPVLSAFTGHVPASFTKRFPQAKVKKTNWGAGFDDVYILDPSDSLFVTIGKAYIKEQMKQFGTDHFYSADTFNENVPPSSDSTYLSAMSRQVFESMSAADPAAIWIMQGWMFHYNSSFWKPTQIQALLNAVPDKQMILLDLYSESHPVWNRTHAYYGKPWIWNMLHNFGGNISLWGRMEAAAKDPSDALHNPDSGKMLGIGLTPEGIEQNPALYQLMLDNIWQDQEINTTEWLQAYVRQRYIKPDPTIDRAWQILLGTVYKGGLGEGGPESILVSRPTINAWGDRVRTKLDYNPKDLLEAWAMFVQAIPDQKQSEGFEYDLVDISRQILANYALPVQQKWVLAYLQHDTVAFDKQARQFLELMDDIDELLSTRKEFLLGNWIESARSNGLDANEKDLYEMNARDMVTLWGNKESELHEYSNRQWAGLIRGFYKPRWEQFFAYMKNKMIRGDRMETGDFEQQIKDWEWNWVNAHDKYPDSPKGSSDEVVRRLYSKYAGLISKECQ